MKVDEPDALADLGDGHVLPGEDATEIDLAAVEADRAAVCHGRRIPAHNVVAPFIVKPEDFSRRKCQAEANRDDAARVPTIESKISWNESGERIVKRGQEGCREAPVRDDRLHQDFHVDAEGVSRRLILGNNKERRSRLLSDDYFPLTISK